MEFLGWASIRARYGDAGVRQFDEAFGGVGAITADTQLSLFTAEAVIRAHNRAKNRGGCSLAAVGSGCYQRWLRTQQGGPLARDERHDRTGWLARQAGLYATRAPGKTCLSALRERGANANESKGCGAVVRMAPVGLASGLEPFDAGVALAALTHGHPTGQLAAGFLAMVVRLLTEGADLADAVARTEAHLRRHEAGDEVARSVRAAVALAAAAPPTPRTIATLGEGWLAEEALAIGLYCALTASSFEEGVLAAVNHGGDSDSTGAITGNLLGLLVGERGIPERWRKGVELRRIVTKVADDLWLHFGLGHKPGGGLTYGDYDVSSDWARYPGN